MVEGTVEEVRARSRAAFDAVGKQIFRSSKEARGSLGNRWGARERARAKIFRVSSVGKEPRKESEELGNTGIV